MVTGSTDVQRYDTWFKNNYCTLQDYCRKYRIEEDILQDVYINVHDRIIRSGYTESYYMTYVKRSIRNLRINEAKKENGKYWIDYDNEDYSATVEAKLREEEETDIDTQQYREEVMYFSKMMFKFIEKREFNQEWQFVFRCYYLMSGRMTYNKLTVMTGMDKSKCTRIIQTIKKDIRENFLQWLHNE